MFRLFSLPRFCSQFGCEMNRSDLVNVPERQSQCRKIEEILSILKMMACNLNLSLPSQHRQVWILSRSLKVGLSLFSGQMKDGLDMARTA